MTIRRTMTLAMCVLGAACLTWGCEPPGCYRDGFVADDVVRTSEPLRCPVSARRLGIVSPGPMSTNVAPDAFVVVDLYVGTQGQLALDNRVRDYVDEAEVVLGDETPTVFRSTWRTRGSDYTGQVVVAELSPEQAWAPGVTRVSTSDLEGTFSFHVGDDAAPFVRRLERMSRHPAIGTRTYALELSEPMEVTDGVRVRTLDGADVPFTWVVSANPASPMYLQFERDAADRLAQGFELTFSPEVASPRSGRPLQWGSPEFGFDAPALDPSVEAVGVDEDGAFVRVGPSGSGAVVFVDAAAE